MTAPAAAPAQAPIVPPASRAAPQPAADRFAFADVLDSIPDAPGKEGASAGNRHARLSSESRGQDSREAQPASPSFPTDGALLAALPFAVRAASMPGEPALAADQAPSEPVAAARAQGPKDAGASTALSAKTATIGRLVGERTFHGGVSNPNGALASRAFAADAPFALVPPSAADSAPRLDAIRDSAPRFGSPQAPAMPPEALAGAVPPSDSARAAASMARRAGDPTAHRSGSVRAAAHEAAPSGEKSEGSPPNPAARVPTSSAAHATGGSRRDGKRAEARPSDPISSSAPAMAQAKPSAAFPPAPFSAGAFLAPDVPSANAAERAPRASAPAASAASPASPVREIDVDLSPGGLEDVSMTMRLAGDKLSVVIRAASSHTANSIEGARDVIADRLAAIGQPLDSLIVRQTGVNTDANTNGNAASGDEGPGGRGSQSGQGGGSNDASARRGAGRDRGF